MFCITGIDYQYYGTCIFILYFYEMHPSCDSSPCSLQLQNHILGSILRYSVSHKPFSFLSSNNMSKNLNLHNYNIINTDATQSNEGVSWLSGYDCITGCKSTHNSGQPLSLILLNVCQNSQIFSSFSSFLS